MKSHFLRDRQAGDIVLESLPDEVLASMESRDRWLASLAGADRAGGFEFLVADLQSWAPGQAVRIAFLGGSATLHQAIEEVTHSISETANIALDFKNGEQYRTWSPEDTEYAAEIRVSFDDDGYFSLVGTDSVNPHIGLPGHPVGGAPHQRTLNLGGFDQSRPADWAGVTRHEFLHALGVHHEHQNMRGPCEAAFRWEDDPGYQPTRDERGGYLIDAAGRRPGIYTYLSGYPNGWSRARVDSQLRAADGGGPLVSGPFDPASVMLYRFPALFYRSHPSPCAPTGDGQQLSDGDKRGLRLLYPHGAGPVDAIGQRRENLLAALAAPGDENSQNGQDGQDDEGGLESAFPSPNGTTGIARDAAARLRASLGLLRP